jgi:hypothetical protein
VTLLPENGRRGKQWRDHRDIANGILWRLRTRVPWRDLPEHQDLNQLAEIYPVGDAEPVHLAIVRTCLHGTGPRCPFESVIALFLDEGENAGAEFRACLPRPQFLSQQPTIQRP